jgi:hypothetical protein
MKYTYPEMLTIRGLIERLEELEKEHGSDMGVGVAGHFGEIHPVTASDVHRTYGDYNFLAPTQATWRVDEKWRKYQNVITIDFADIGPDPD